MTRRVPGWQRRWCWLSRGRWCYGLVAAAVALLCVLGYFMLGPDPASGPKVFVEEPTPAPPTRPVVATLTAHLDARWAGPDTSASLGTPLRRGEHYTLVHGIAQFQTRRGALVVIEAPCAIEFVDEHQVRLAYGKLMGHCPSVRSRGLIIDTPSTRVVDIGTEFGVVTDQAGTTAVEVFTGAVTVRPEDAPDQSALTVLEGQTADNERGELVVGATPPGRSRFSNRKVFERRDQWLAYRERLMDDPSLLAYYPFDEPAGDRLAEARGERVFDGAINGATWTAGRFPWKRGLRFDGPGSLDHVALSAEASARMNFTGSFSVAVWFKARPFTADWQSLITKGETQWRIARDTMWEGHPDHGTDDHEASALNFGYDNLTGVSPPDLPGRTRVDDGAWHLAVIVFESTSTGRGIKHLYIDGVADATPTEAQSVRPSPNTVWIGGNSQQRVRREFEGVIDEVAIFERALSPDEVQLLYREGVPPD